MENLGNLRAEIDALDGRIVEDLLKRMRVSRAIGEAKRATGAAVFDPAREEAILARLSREGGADAPGLARIYRTIFEVSRSLQ